MDTLCLDMLPLEILLVIFDYCNLHDLARLDQVCKRFHQIVRSDVVWKRHYKKFLVTNQVSKQFRERCNLLLPSYSKCFIWQNWTHGRYQQHVLRGQQRKLMPWLQLTNDKLWWSGGNMLRSFNRQESHENIFSFDPTSPGKYEQDIWRFVLWRDYVLTGHNNGSVKWQVEFPVNKNRRNKYVIKNQMNVHNKPISALDATANLIFSASRYEYAIIRVQDNLDSIGEDNVVRRHVNSEFKIRSLACHPLGTKLSVALSGDFSKVLHMDLEYDFKEMEAVSSFDSGIMDILWEDHNTLLTCGYCRIQKWDLRVNRCVCMWDDPTDAGSYCISSDHHNTMITGTQYHSKAVLWDQRMHKFVQMYYMKAPRKYDSNSPVYSLRFDSTNLYCATDRYLYELDFSKRGCPARDYTSIFHYFNYGS